MLPEKTKRLIIISSVIFIAFIVLFTALFWFGYFPRLSEFFGGGKIIAEDKNLITSAAAIELAKPDALKWRPDAKLAQINAKGKISPAGKSDSWILRFSSESTEGKGYEILIKNRAVASAKEIVFYWKGADLPAAGFLGEEEALKKFRQIGGYENVTVQSIELIPSADGKSWFYGIKTEKGVITLPAEK